MRMSLRLRTPFGVTAYPLGARDDGGFRAAVSKSLCEIAEQRVPPEPGRRASHLPYECGRLDGVGLRTKSLDIASTTTSPRTVQRFRTLNGNLFRFTLHTDNMPP